MEAPISTNPPPPRRLLLRHPHFPSRCGARAAQEGGLELVELAEAPGRVPPGSLVAAESEAFLARPECFPPELREKLPLLRDKGRFRALMNRAACSLSVPHFTCSRERLAQGLPWMEVMDRLGGQVTSVVLKPVRGFQSDLVFVCRSASEWEAALATLRNAELECAAVTDPGQFLVEPWVAGEEWAVDLYFDALGMPIILGLYLHPFRDDTDARDVVYRTSPALMKRMRLKLTRALLHWNNQLGLRGLPVHAELRVTPHGELFPIEFNLARFGLLTMDIALHAFGINPYLYFFQRRTPDWGSIEAQAEWAPDTGLVVAPRVGPYTPGLTADREAFLESLRKRGLELLHCEPLPFDRIPFFAAAYVRGRAEDMDAYLSLPFAQYLQHEPEHCPWGLAWCAPC